MYHMPLLAILQIALVVLASTHCAVGHGQAVRSAKASSSPSSQPLSKHHTCDESGCICRGAIFGHEVTGPSDHDACSVCWSWDVVDHGLHAGERDGSARVNRSNPPPLSASVLRAQLQSFLL